MTVNGLIAGMAMAVLAGVIIAAATGCVTAQGEPAATATDTQTADPGSAEGDETMATATFGAGCFWGVEEAFRQVEGVTETAVGYEGGHVEHPSYEQVCGGRKGMARVEGETRAVPPSDTAGTTQWRARSRHGTLRHPMMRPD